MNPLCYFEIPAPDMDKAVSFYSKVFGWKINQDSPGYAMFDDGNLGGGFDASKTPTVNGISLVLKVDDINLKLNEIEAAGGKTSKPKTQISEEFGYYASFIDTNGNELSIWSKD